MMRNKTLEIFAKLPLDVQKPAILGALEQMLAAGEWIDVEGIVQSLLMQEGEDYFDARIFSLGIRCAVRLGNYELAMDRWASLENMRFEPETALLKAEMERMLVIHLPARWHGQLYEVWEKSLTPDMPEPVQEIQAATGMLLEQTFRKNHNERKAMAVRDAMRKKLSENVLRKAGYQHFSQRS